MCRMYAYKCTTPKGAASCAARVSFTGRLVFDWVFVDVPFEGYVEVRVETRGWGCRLGFEIGLLACFCLRYKYNSRDRSLVR